VKKSSTKTEPPGVARSKARGSRHPDGSDRVLVGTLELTATVTATSCFSQPISFCVYKHTFYVVLGLFTREKKDLSTSAVTRCYCEIPVTPVDKPFFADVYERRLARNSCLSNFRPSKMGRKWTQFDLLAYKIKVVYQDLQTFFGVTDLPPPDVEGDALTAPDSLTANGYSTRNMLFHMDSLAVPSVDRKSAMFNFATHLLHVVRYSTMAPMRNAAWCPKLDYMTSRGRHPQLDVCLVDKSMANLLIVKVARELEVFDSEPRLISDTIAAFHNDNLRLGRDLDPLASKVMPGIIMDGTIPTFYKIPITPELVRAVEYGEHPKEETVVHVYRPEVYIPGYHPEVYILEGTSPEEGIRRLDNRYIIFSCFAAFKKFVY